MFILAIRTDKPEAEVSLYQGNKKLDCYSWQAHRQLAETLHTKIAELLKRNGKDWQAIDGVVVYRGPGSFTGLRIGLSVANALAYGLPCATIGATGDNWVSEGCRQLQQDQGERLIVPDYGAPAHITQPRK